MSHRRNEVEPRPFLHYMLLEIIVRLRLVVQSRARFVLRHRNFHSHSDLPRRRGGGERVRECQWRAVHA